MTTKPVPNQDEAKPVAWRWRCLYDQRPGHWTLRASPISSRGPRPGFVGIEAEPLYLASAPTPTVALDIERLEELLAQANEVRNSRISAATKFADLSASSWPDDDRIKVPIRFGDIRIAHATLSALPALLSQRATDKATIERLEARVDEAARELETIVQMTDPADPESYHSDDPEGCLETVHTVATVAAANARAAAQWLSSDGNGE